MQNISIPELAAQIITHLRNNPEMIVEEGGKFKKVYVRIIDSGMIGTETHSELEAGRAALKAASNETEKIAALEKLVAAHDVILDGRKEE